MASKRLHVRIAASLLALLLVALLSSLVLANSIVAAGVHSGIEDSLAAGERVFGLVIDDKKRTLLQSASVLSSDFAFRQAVATADRGTLQSALLNHSSRIGADIALLVDMNGLAMADTRRSGIGQGAPDLADTPPAFAFPALIRAAEQHRDATACVLMDGRLYQLVAVPVLAPLPVAWLVVGLRVDDLLAHSLRSLTLLDIAFAVRADAGASWQVLGSTLAPGPVQDLALALRDADADRGARVEFRLADDPYAAHLLTMDGVAPQTVVAVLQRSVQQALEPLHHLQRLLLLLAFGVIAAGVVASWRLARSITRPIAALAQWAGRIEQGDYSVSPATTREDEVGQLAQAFDHMREGLAAREARISELAFSDSLTGLANRALLNDRLAQSLRVAQREGTGFAVLILDLDRFREVNDILGHAAGDRLLRTMARRLESGWGHVADAIARLGGDEFAMLLPAMDAREAQAMAAQMNAALAEPVQIDNQSVAPSAAIGIACYPDHGRDSGELLRHADLAMAMAKAQQSGFAVFDASFDRQDQGRLSLMTELRHAVDDGELVLFYQPKVDLQRRTLGSVEALVRWRHPVRGLVPPGEFIPYAENTGFIRRITRWALDAALRQRLAWQAMGLPLRISVNISTRDLMHSDLPEIVAELLQRHGARPDWLQLEITESAIMGDAQRALSVLERLHGMGLRLSVDDFGTGYSSLAYLKKLPVTELKIDMSFVRNMDQDKDDAAIVRSTIDLGHNMGLKVVAEGVESAAIWQCLLEMGCDLAQGYHLSRPIDAEALQAWIPRSGWSVVAEA